MKLFLQSAVAAVVSLVLGSMVASVALTPAISSGFETYLIPRGYYGSTCQRPAHLTFYDWMATLPMPPYELHAFDCSQMAMYVEWLSENCGHRATISGAFGGSHGHLWVMIEIGGMPFAYEPGNPPGDRWVLREDDWYYSPDTEWEGIYDSPLEYDLFGMEYAWWGEHPSLVTATW